MSEFAGQEYDFAAGATKGLRSWNMDSLGRLHGVTHEEVWRPGENVSVCKKEGQTPCPQINRREEARKASEAGRAQLASKKKRKKRDEDFVTLTFTASPDFAIRTACADPACVRGEYHIVSSGHRFDPACECGFWAYDEGGFKAHGSVVGVIEGYGKTTVGTKGFRSEKARIVALSCEDSEGNRHSRSTLARLAALYPEVAFADNQDALIDAYPEVLRDWPEVDEGFWLRPVESKRESFGWTWAQMSARLASHYSVPSSSYYSGGIV